MERVVLTATYAVKTVISAQPLQIVPVAQHIREGKRGMDVNFEEFQTRCQAYANLVFSRDDGIGSV